MQEAVKKPLDINQFWALEHYPVFTLGVNKKNIENFGIPKPIKKILLEL